MFSGEQLGQALREAMERKGVKQAAVAAAFDVTQPSVSEWLRYGRVGKKHITKLVDWFSDVAGPEHWGLPTSWAGNAPAMDPADFQHIKRVDVSFSNGNGQVVYSEDDRPPLVFRADFLRRLGISQGNAVVVDAHGVSNEPKIPDGSVVLVDRGNTERLDGSFFAFRVDGELLIKRLSKLDGVGIIATAENSSFSPKNVIYTDAEDFQVIGRAVWTGALL